MSDSSCSEVSSFTGSLCDTESLCSYDMESLGSVDSFDSESQYDSYDSSFIDDSDVSDCEIDSEYDPGSDMDWEM